MKRNKLSDDERDDLVGWMVAACICVPLLLVAVIVVTAVAPDGRLTLQGIVEWLTQ